MVYIPYNKVNTKDRDNHMSFEVEYYEDKNGEYPVEEFILSQEEKMQAKIFRMIALLEEYGNQLREPYSKELDDKIFELRIKQSSNITRILYFFVVGRKIILTNGFVKKQDKTPPGEIKLAKERRELYYKSKKE